MTSLDQIRRDLRVSPDKKQHQVIAAAKETAKEYLRKGVSFIWNATNVTRAMRKQLIDLFVAYNAKTKIIYLEPEYQR